MGWICEKCGGEKAALRTLSDGRQRPRCGKCWGDTAKKMTMEEMRAIAQSVTVGPAATQPTTATTPPHNATAPAPSGHGPYFLCKYG